MLSCSECGKEFKLKDRFAVEFKEQEGFISVALDFCSEKCHNLFKQ